MVRNVRISLCLLGALLLGSSPPTYALTCPSAPLLTGATATGASTPFLSPGVQTKSVAFQYIRNAGTATVEIEACCSDDCSAGGDWLNVAGSSKSIDGTTLTDGIGITFPACLYRANITACAACNVDVWFRCGTQ